VDRAVHGGLAAQGHLLERFQPLLEGEVRRFLGPKRFQDEGEDLLQTVQLRIVRKIHLLRSRDRARLIVWLRAVTRTVCLDWERSQKRASRTPGAPRRLVRLPTGCQVVTESPTPSRVLMGREEVERLSGAIDAVSERYRPLLRFLAEKDPELEEVARFLVKDPEAARKFMARALKQLKQALANRK
jgi:RNA polymerase sigma factor (sigma-70 family)